MHSRVREMREAQGWSQGELAERLSVSRQTVNAIETGKYDPSLPLAFRIARLFDATLEAIFLPDPEPDGRAPAPTSRTSATPADPTIIVPPTGHRRPDLP
jgi:putative transcriptional regulator